MGKLNFVYLLKNISTSDKKGDKLRLLEKIDIFIKNALESYHFYKEHQKSTGDKKQVFSYGLKSNRSPPQIKDLIQFEDHLVRIVKKN